MSSRVLPILRKTLSQRPEWRHFAPRQLAILLFLHGYLAVPPEEMEVAAALPCALDDRDLLSGDGAA